MLKFLVLAVVAALVFGRRGRLGDLVRTVGALPSHFRRGKELVDDPARHAKPVEGEVVEPERE